MYNFNTVLPTWKPSCRIGAQTQRIAYAILCTTRIFIYATVCSSIPPPSASRRGVNHNLSKYFLDILGWLVTVLPYRRCTVHRYTLPYAHAHTRTRAHLRASFVQTRHFLSFLPSFRPSLAETHNDHAKFDLLFCFCIYFIFFSSSLFSNFILPTATDYYVCAAPHVSSFTRRDAVSFHSPPPAKRSHAITSARQ